MTLENPDRIWFGIDESPPKPGMVLVLNYHHDGESHWCAPQQAIDRIECILDGGKPEEEWGTRMEAMKIVPWSFQNLAVNAKLQSERDAVSAKWQSELDAVNAKWQSERDALYPKWQSELDEVNVKWWSELDVVYPAEAWAAEYKESLQ